MRFPRSLSALLAIFFVAGAIYSVSTPILEASDELWHMAVVEHLSQGRGLPIQDPNQHGFYEQEGSQPPLYYLFLAGFAGAFDLSDFRDRAQFNPHGKLGRADTRTNWNITLHSAAEDFPWRRTTLFVHVARLLGVLMGMVTVWAVWGISTELGAALAAAGIRLPGLPLAATALVALNPMFVFISASVNNDTLAVLLSSLSLLIGMRALTTGLTSRSALALGIFLGGAALTKSSGLALCVVVPGALAVSALVKGARTGACPRRLGPALMSGLVAAAIAGWFYVRNQLLYGDFTGTQMMALIAGQRERLPTASELLGEFEGFSQSYIGLFGAVNIPIAGAIYALFNALLVFAGLGLLSLASAWRKSWRGWVGMLNAPTTLPAGMLAAVFLVAALALVRWTSLTSASQGRLLFPAIGAISSLVAAGALALAGRIHPLLPARATAALAVSLAAVTLISPFAYILPAYALPARFTTEQALPPDLGRTELRYGDAGGPLLRWIGYTASPSRVKDGDMVVLDLYWQGLRPIDLNYSVAVKLFGRDDALIANADITPGRGMWQTRRWAPGEIVVERVELPARATERLGAGSPPTELKLDVTWYQYDPETQAQTILKTYDGAGRETGRQRYGVAGYASAPPVSAPVTGQRLSDVRVTDAAQIAKTAGVLTVETRWYVTRDFTQDLTVFMHVFNARGEKVTQADGAPAGGDFPTRWWRAGDVIVDRRDLEVAGGFAPGTYSLKFGLYTPSGDFARMPAFDAAGAPLPDSALTTVIVLR